MENRGKLKAMFIIPSAIGVILFMIPVKNAAGEWTVTVKIIADIIAGAIGGFLPILSVAIVTISAVMTLVALAKPKFIMESPVLNSCFICGPFWIVVRVLGAIFAWITFLELGADKGSGILYAISSADQGGFVLYDLIGTLVIINVIASFLLPLLTDFGLLEYVGALATKLMRPLFKVPGRAAVDCVTSWIGDGTLGVMLTLNQYEGGYYTAKEASIIATLFSAVSITFALVVLGLFAANMVARICRMIRGVSNAYAGTNISKRLRTLVFDKITSLSYGKISKKQTGELMERVNSDTREIQNQLTGMIPELIYQLTIIIWVSVIIFSFDWKLGLLIFLPFPFIFVGFYSFWNFTRRNYHKQWTKSSKTATILHDIFNGIRVVKSFGMEKSEAKRYDNSADELRRISIKNDVFFSIISPVLNFGMGIGEFFLLYYAGNKILSGEMTLGTMMQFSSYITIIYARMRWFTNIPRRLVAFMTSVSKIFELLDEKSDITDGEKNKNIEIENKHEKVLFSF